MANIDLAHDPEITQERVEAELQSAFGNLYRVYSRGKDVFVAESGWKGAAVRVQHKEGSRTRLRVNRQIPEMKNRLLLVPLILVAFIGFFIAFFAITMASKPIEDVVKLQLEKTYAGGTSAATAG